MEVFTSGNTTAIEIDYSTPDNLRWVTVRYVSDTQVALNGQSNNAQLINIFGVKLTD